jgi:hypothetical protein
MEENSIWGVIFMFVFIFSFIGFIGFFLIKTQIFEEDKYVKCKEIETIYNGTCEDFRKEITIKYYETKLNDLNIHNKGE